MTDENGVDMKSDPAPEKNEGYRYRDRRRRDTTPPVGRDTATTISMVPHYKNSTAYHQVKQAKNVDAPRPLYTLLKVFQ